MALDINKEDCCGCGLCSNVCPQECIKMCSDGEGFLYPNIDVDSCINCGLCEKKCPALNKPNVVNEKNCDVYAAWNKDEKIRISSTSGGVVSAMYEYVIENGGYIVGAYYKEDYTVAHMIGESEKDILLLKQSKYMQSDMGVVYKKIQELLDMGKMVLFCGTPCHNAAVRKYIDDKNGRLYLVDFVCRGVCSPKVFLEYLKFLEKKYKSRTIKVQFKNKDYGWNRFSTKIIFENGKEYIKDRYHDPYMVSYLRYSVTLRPSCYECKFKGDERYSDITVGDFWGVGEVDSRLDTDKGTSLVIRNTLKGKEFFDLMKGKLVYTECRLDDIKEGNMCLHKAPAEGKYRTYYFKDLGKRSFGYIYFKYVIRRKWYMLLKKTVGLLGQKSK